MKDEEHLVYYRNYFMILLKTYLIFIFIGLILCLRKNFSYKSNKH